MRHLIWAFALLATIGSAHAANFVPTEVQMPGTQPGEVLSPLTAGNPVSTRLALDPAQQCSFCHANYSTGTEPGHNWQGSMMAQAARDPIFWATLAIAEQDFDGSGDFCLRCHTSNAWLAGRSVPTDGSALTSRDVNGIECDTCHRMTNPDGKEHKGVQNPPFIANNKASSPIGYFGSAQYVMWGDNDKLGPYANSITKHPSLKSNFHRSPDFCGTCHDVSNPVTGDLAHNNGAQFPLPPGTYSGVLGSAVGTKAAFNNFPYAYGVVERTYSEFKASLWPTTPLTNYGNLPADLRDGSIKAAYDASAATGYKYEDGATKYFICQSCHLKPTTGEASSKLHNAPKTRKDLPVHDLTGGNYWTPEAIKYMSAKGTLRMGNGLSTEQIAAIDAGIVRAKSNLAQAAKLSVTGNSVKVVNLTGHKLISGYPEGRRMWLNIKWYNSSNALLREDGAYGPVSVTLDGATRQVDSLLDLKGTNTKIYEVKGSMTQKWATQLLGMGYRSDLPLSFNRQTGQVDFTLGDLARLPIGQNHETFHFVLNNHVAKDNRIPPYGMKYADAKTRNALPVPFCQFGCPSATGTFQYYDILALAPPKGSKTATVTLMYQPTSWEYIQFLYLANTRSNSFLAQEGVNLLDAWLNTGMSKPYAMATVNWTCTAKAGC